jgi:hypothetical protein
MTLGVGEHGCQTRKAHASNIKAILWLTAIAVVALALALGAMSVLGPG